jgi:endonuclease YncB( thermonuclease family)
MRQRFWLRRRRRIEIGVSRFSVLVFLLLLGLALLAHLQQTSPPPPPRTAPTAFIVVDGHTVKSPAGVTYRLLGFDTPETFRAKCPDELERGQKAKARLEELIGSGEARVIESGKRDRYGRMLAKLTIDGRDVAGMMIGEGLARAYNGERRQGWCGNP